VDDDNWKLCGWHESSRINSLARLPPLSYAMDPEQMKLYADSKKNEHASSHSDVWAAGRIICECILGKPPCRVMDPPTYNKVLLQESL
jgi:serine/threonine protein kinase